jgi:hypothetical protein
LTIINQSNTAETINFKIKNKDFLFIFHLDTLNTFLIIAINHL